MVQKITPSVSKLVSRVKDGNQKVAEFWEYATTLDTESFFDACDKYDEAFDRLHDLCQHLILSGYRDCLYPNGEKPSCTEPFICMVCPRPARPAAAGHGYIRTVSEFAKNAIRNREVCNDRHNSTCTSHESEGRRMGLDR